MSEPTRDELATAAACYFLPPELRKIERRTIAIDGGLSYWLVPKDWPLSCGDFHGDIGVRDENNTPMTRDEEIELGVRILQRAWHFE